MRLTRIAPRLVIATAAFCMGPVSEARGDQLLQRPALHFEANHGQFDAGVRFVSRADGYTLFLTDTEAVLALDAARSSNANALTPLVRLTFDGGRRRAAVGEQRLPGIVNYLYGRDPAAWRTDIPTYARVKYEGLYPGIDLVYYGRGALHEYDFEVAPGADPSQIALHIGGADRIDIDDGNLRLITTAGTLTMRAPKVYQLLNGERHEVAARYTIDGADRVAFALGPYDTRAALVIDPELVYGTFLGGTGNGLDAAKAVAVDSSGAAYILGSTETTDFPTQDPLQSARRGLQDLTVVKLAPDGQRVYATYLGGGSYDYAEDIAVRADGIAYIVGSTTSDDFPIRSAYQDRRRGQTDAFLVELSRDGRSISRGTYLGGADVDEALGVQLTQFRDGQSLGNAFGDWVFVYGVTRSSDFPTINAAQNQRIGERDAFVMVLERDSLSPGYSTYIGREGDNLPESLILKRGRGDFYLFLKRAQGGATIAPVFARFTRRAAGAGVGTQTIAEIWSAAVYLVQADLEERAEANPSEQLKAAKPLQCEEHDVFEEKGDWFCYGDPVGNRSDRVEKAITTEELARTAFVMTMPGCLPVPPSRTCTDRAVMVFYDADVRIVAHLNFGGPRRGREFIPLQMVVDRDRRYHLIGTTSDNGLPVVNPVQSTYKGSSEGFIITLDPRTGDTSFFSYLGGSTFDTLADIAIDKDGHRWIVGETQSSDFPITRSGVQPEMRGRIDAFVVKITP